MELSKLIQALSGYEKPKDEDAILPSWDPMDVIPMERLGNIMGKAGSAISRKAAGEAPLAKKVIEDIPTARLEPEIPTASITKEIPTAHLDPEIPTVSLNGASEAKLPPIDSIAKQSRKEALESTIDKYKTMDDVKTMEDLLKRREARMRYAEDFPKEAAERGIEVSKPLEQAADVIDKSPLKQSLREVVTPDPDGVRDIDLAAYHKLKKLIKK